MRPDLAKCTTERERRGARGKCWKTKYGGKVRIHSDSEHDYLDEHGGFRSSSRHRHQHSKDFSDVLNPLRGNLRVNIGRKWDDVFSEFSKHLDRRGVSGYHIWTHLVQEVTTKTFMGADGKIYERARYAGILEVDGFYVHPLTGILEYKERDNWWRKSKKEQGDIRVPGNEAWVYRQIDGLWFAVLPGLTYAYNVRSVLTGRYQVREGAMEEIILQKRSANKKEIAWIKAQLKVVQ